MRLKSTIWLKCECIIPINFKSLSAFEVQIETQTSSVFVSETSNECSLLQGVCSGGLVGELFGETDEDSFGAAEVAEAVEVLVLDDLADEFRAAFGEACEQVRRWAVSGVAGC